jgi:hypothetical protein
MEYLHVPLAAYLVHPARRDLLVLRVLRERRGQQVRLVRQVRRVTRVPKARWVVKGLRASTQ